VTRLEIAGGGVGQVRRAGHRFRWLALGALAFSCSREQGEPPARVDVDPATARSSTATPETAAIVRREWEARSDPADGRGHAWLDGASDEVPRYEREQPVRFVIVYEAEGSGIAVGGSLELRVPLAFGWSTPRLTHPEMPGYLEIESPAGVTFEGSISREATPRRMARFRLGGRPLAAGERVRILYTSSTDVLAERGERFWISVDGDGDGQAAALAASPQIEILAGKATQLVAFWPATAHPGERVRLRVAALDDSGNLARGFEGPIEVKKPFRVEGSESLASSGSTRTAEYVIEDEGVYQLKVVGRNGLEATTNPLLVSRDAPRIVWGDIHGHSNRSDGTGTPRDYFSYARDVAGLDVAALTDHDHWGGPLRIDADPAGWQEIRDEVQRFDEPGRFVTLLGYEWTSWLHGHRHVLYFQDDGPVLSSADPRYETPAQLWAGLRGLPALTFTHHSAGGPIATNWAFAPDPVLEPLVEIVSVAGSSESPDSPRVLKNAVAGNFVRDALGRGYRLGFVGSGDSHDGHPGCPQLTGCGLVAIQTEQLTREAVFEALRARRTYATNGPRIVLDVRLDEYAIGAVLPPARSRTLSMRVNSLTPILKLDLVRNGVVVETIDCERRRELRIERTVRDLASGDWLYLRVVQIDDGAAWSSPFFVE
jgi:hypothetical protein